MSVRKHVLMKGNALQHWPGKTGTLYRTEVGRLVGRLEASWLSGGGDEERQMVAYISVETVASLLTLYTHFYSDFAK